MLEHLNSISWDRLLGVFKKEYSFGNVGHRQDKDLIQSILLHNQYTMKNHGWVENLGFMDIKFRAYNEDFYVQVTRTRDEEPWVINLRICMFYKYPDGWIDMPD